MQHQDRLSYELKDDKPVTDTDLQIEILLRSYTNFFNPFYLEKLQIFKNSNFKWIDPINGTFSFTKSVPLFGILLGLLCLKRFGCLRFPLLGNKLVVGDGKKLLKMVDLFSLAKMFL